MKSRYSLRAALNCAAVIALSASVLSAAGLPLVSMPQGEAIPDGETYGVDPADAKEVALRYARFDPLRGQPRVEPALQALPGARLHLVQFRSGGRDLYRETMYRETMRGLGAEVHQYMPHDAHLVRMDAQVAAEVASLPFVRWIGSYQPAYRLHETLLEENRAGGILPGRFNLLVVAKSDKEALARKLELLGGRIANFNTGSILLEADLAGDLVVAAAHLDEVLWIDRWSPIEEDIDNARIQGGADYVESLGGGYTGIGLRGHVLEGIYATHPDFAAIPGIRSAPIAVDDGTASSHGSNTYGEIYGSGANRPQARGILPDAQGYYTHYSAVYSAPAGSTGAGSRYDLTRRLVNTHNVMFQTASWGYARTTTYDARSAEMDDIIFDFDLPVSNSQSNSGGTPSRPQAWAKNVFSGGGVRHYNTANPGDDAWAGSASIGPANDGRIKPTLCAYYDSILTTSGTSSYTTSFGGTSGATPIVNGYMGMTVQMWTDGVFGNVLPSPGGSRFANRPHFTTVKALMCNTARQYTFSGTSHDLTRVHQGWGFPSAQDMWDLKDKMLVINEDELLTGGQSKVYTVTVDPSTPLLRATLNWNEPPGNPAAAYQRVNNLDLRVTAPSGVVYWGNNGLLAGMFSTSGGSHNTIDTIENVFIQNPMPGPWTVEVIADQVNQDNHVETPAVDVDFALVVSGISAGGGPGQAGTAELLELPFDETRGTLTANTASTPAAPAHATVSNTGWHAEPGPGRERFKGNERGFGCLGNAGAPAANLVDTGWAMNVSGSMSISFWARMGTTAPATSLAYAFGGDGGNFRCFTGGVAASNLMFRGTTAVGDLTTSAGVQVPGWKHYALVIDDATGTASWYVNGVQDATKSFTAGTFTATSTAFHVGYHTSTASSFTGFYDLDDFRFYSRALGATDVVEAMQHENPFAATYDDSPGCSGPLGRPEIKGGNGLPTIGNLRYTVELENASAGRSGAMVIGFFNDMGGLLPLPLPFLGRGCQLSAFPDIAFPIVTDRSGRFVTPAPIPGDPNLAGFHLYCQYLILDTTGAVTPGLDVGIDY